VLNQTSLSTLIEAWVLAPALVIAGSAALGWLLARGTGTDLGALTVPAGFLAGVSVATMVLSIGISGKLTVALLVLLGIAGVVVAALDLRRRGGVPRIDRGVLWPAAAFLAAYAIALAPVVGSGHSAVLGYQMNGDSAVHVTVVEEIAQRDARAHDVNQDSVHAVTRDLEAGYPLGSYAWPLFARVLTGIDAFHLWVPLSGVVLALMALVAYAILRTLTMPRGFAAAGGTLTGVGYLVYSYHGQGGTKEILMPLAVYCTVALAARALEGPAMTRSLIPAAVAASAEIANLGYGAFAWLVPAGVGVVAILGWRAWRDRSYAPLKPLVAAAPFAIVLALPAVVRTLTFFEGAKRTISGGVGNLFGGLPFRETFPVWLAHDYRHYIPDAVDVTDIGVWLSIVLCVVGGVWALWRRNLAVSLSLVAGLAAVALITPRASIYFDAKSYVVAAPALGIAAATGVFAVARRAGAMRVVGLAAGVLLAVGALVSDAYVYSGVWVTPRFRFDELGQVAERTRGQGPMLVNDGDEWAAYILRDSKAWTEHALRSPEGEYTHPGGRRPVRPLDPDDYSGRHIETFPLILDRKTPYGSRPPGNYVQTFETKRYRLWQRRGTAPVFHVPLGSDGYVGAARLDCEGGKPRDSGPAFVFRAARRAGLPLHAAVGPAEPIVAIEPHSWVGFRAVALFKPAGFIAMTDGSASAEVTVRPGRYDTWIAGSLGPGIGLWARPAGRVVPNLVGGAANDMGLPALWQPIAVAELTHRSILHASWVDRPWWRASSRRPNVIGPIVLTPAGDRARVVDVPAARASSLCGKRLDWLELYKPS